MTESLAALIRKSRPNIKDNTIQSYIGYINKLYHNINSSTAPPTNYDWLTDVDQVKKAIEVYQSTTKKNIFNAIVVGLGALGQDKEIIETYSLLRDNEHKNYETMVKNHQKSKKQEENWVELSEIDDILKRLKRQANEVYKSKKVYNEKRDYPILQQYIVLLTYRHIPMRNDLANMRVITPQEYEAMTEEQRDSANYLVGAPKTPFYFQINQYKTKKTFGQKRIKIPPVLNKEIRRWLTINKSGYFITNASKRNPITPNGITKLLTTLFQEHTGKSVSTSMIRHIYLSDKYKSEIAKQKEKEADSHAMGHSLAQQMDYVKA